MTRYLLAKHAYLCMAEDHAVILDLKRDAYFALSKAQASTLVHVVADWPRPPVGWSAPADSHSHEHCASAVRALLDKELLTINPLLGKSAAPARIEAPDTPLLATALLHTLLVDDPSVRAPRVRPLDAAAFLVAYLSAMARLRYRGLARVVNAVHQRGGRVKRGATDTQRLRRLVQTFRLIRPFVYTATNRCLFDSLVLIEFLALYGMHPLWVFGVTTRPFTAHCWVQEGRFVLNDTPEHAGQFAPIMVA